MRNKTKSRLTALGCLLLLSGCYNWDDPDALYGTHSTGSTTTDTKAETQTAGTEKETEKEMSKRETKNALTAYLTEEDMALANPWKSSDMAGLAAVMKKAERKEPVTIAVLGGSITEGTISLGTKDGEVPFKKKYADLFFEWFKTTFPDTEIKTVNAGIGATDSYLGVHRLEPDVLSHEPDLVLLEYSVNDTGNLLAKRTYDNLINRIARNEKAPAILLLFMGQTDGVTAQNTHSQLGFNYGLPMVSYHNVISSLMKENRYTDKELSGDAVHPSSLGHAICGEMLWKYLNAVYEELDSYGEPAAFPDKAVTKQVYQNAKILDNRDLTPEGEFVTSSVFSHFPNGWSAVDGNSTFSFTATFHHLGFIFYRQTDGKGAAYDVYVDGKQVYTLDGDFSGGWGNYAECKEVYASDEAAAHTVLLKRKEGDEGEAFSILGLLVSE